MRRFSTCLLSGVEQSRDQALQEKEVLKLPLPVWDVIRKYLTGCLP